ncbi:YbaY family lipoprotein [Sphingomicrobium aestuariivivum]|uniref:YbaY family lipoprotein n=1 Tax=Sphingomicrobium aestuariivivum TaxID=1582356 RepID=UPI001FD6A40D|nr:YbaY family lipoprotein [Sphingomicrobium aestuariivivum]MCJ8190919.1 YbaY family lipoprotein [Sphingomicrobium aestuariivivum]
MSRHMTFDPAYAFAIAAFLPLAACATDDYDTAAETYTIEGEMTYRERIALPPGAYYRATLLDVSRADAPADVIASEVRRVDEGESVPLDFSIEADSDRFIANHRYSVRAMIYNVNNELLWTSDTNHPYDPAPGATDIGTIMLVRTGGQQGATGLSGTWEVYAINGTAITSENKPSITWNDGQVSGSTGCNQFTGSFQQYGDRVQIGDNVAMTQRACVPPYDAMEQQFIGTFNDLAGFRFNGEGMVTFIASNGGTLTARPAQ